jgi:hypothetical protein
MHLVWGGKHYLGFYVGEFPMYQKYWWWANQMAPFGEKKTKKQKLFM